MTVKMTERLKRALGDLSDAGAALADANHLAQVIAAYREARDAPKTGRFEVGQLVQWGGMAYEIYGQVTSYLIDAPNRTCDRSMRVQEDYLEPIPAPAEEQGEGRSLWATTTKGIDELPLAVRETPLTVERLVRVLREHNRIASGYVDWTRLADALEAEEE